MKLNKKNWKKNRRKFIASALVIIILISIFAHSFNLESSFLFPLIGAVGGSFFGPIGTVSGAIVGYGVDSIKEVYAIVWLIVIKVVIVVGSAIYGANKGANAYANQCSIFVPDVDNYDCNSCNENPLIPCTEYRCLSIGQRCNFAEIEGREGVQCYEKDGETNPPSVEDCKAITLNQDLDYLDENPVNIITGGYLGIDSLTGNAVSQPNQCGFGCCWSGDVSAGIGAGFTTTRDGCDISNPNTEFLLGVVCEGANTLDVFLCPIGASLSGDGYCRCDNSVCSKSQGGICGNVESVTLPSDGSYSLCSATNPVEQFRGRIAYEITTDEPTICRYSFERKFMFDEGNLEGISPFGYRPSTFSDKHYFVTGFGSVDADIVDLDLLRQECNEQTDLDGDGIVPCQIYVQCKDLNNNIMTDFYALGFDITLAPDRDGPSINLADGLRGATLRPDQSNVPVVDIIAEDDSEVRGCKVFTTEPSSFDDNGGLNLEIQMIELENGEVVESNLFSLPEGQSINVGTGDATLYIVCRDDVGNDAQLDPPWVIPRVASLQTSLSDAEEDNIEVTTEDRNLGVICTTTTQCSCFYRYRQVGSDEWDISYSRFNPDDIINNREYNLGVSDILNDGNSYEVNVVCVDDNTGARDDITWTVNMNVHPITINSFSAGTSGDGRTVTTSINAAGGSSEDSVECNVFSSMVREDLVSIGFDGASGITSGSTIRNGANFEYTFPNKFSNGQHYLAAVCRDSSNGINKDREIISKAISTPDIDISFIPSSGTTISQTHLDLIIETRGGISNGDVTCKYIGGNARDLQQNTATYDEISNDFLIRDINRESGDHVRHTLRLPATGELSAGTHAYKIICKEEETGKENDRVVTYIVNYAGLEISDLTPATVESIRPILDFTTTGGRNSGAASCTMTCNDIAPNLINVRNSGTQHTVTFSQNVQNGLYGCTVICNDGGGAVTDEVSFTVNTPAITIESVTLSPIMDENEEVEHSRPALIVETKGGRGNGLGDAVCYYLTPNTLGNTVLNSDFSNNNNKVLLDNAGVSFATGQGITKHRKILPTLAQGSENTYFIQCKNFEDGKLANKRGSDNTYYQTLFFKVNIPDLYLENYDITNTIAPSYSWHFMSKGGANNGDVSCNWGEGSRGGSFNR